jgi:hypothetical protein
VAGELWVYLLVVIDALGQRGTVFRGIRRHA